MHCRTGKVKQEERFPQKKRVPLLVENPGQAFGKRNQCVGKFINRTENAICILFILNHKP